MSYNDNEDDDWFKPNTGIRLKLRYWAGWVFIRPIRKFFSAMLRGSFYNSCGVQWLPKHDPELVWLCDCYGVKPRWWRLIRWPDFHWVFLYRTVFRFFSWLHYDAWRPLCTWDRFLKHKPWYAAVIQRIGGITAGGAISCYECYHCASKRGCQIELSNDESGKYFVLEDTWTSSTENGTDHRFRGKTICPKCGYEDEYEDGSL